MNYQIENLLCRIARWYKSPADSVPDVTVEAARHLPPPQVTWTLLGLIHYYMRKIWAWKLFKKHLRSHVKSLPARVSIQDVLEATSEGIISGMPEWSYNLDGNEGFITNRVTGEQLPIDIFNGPGLIGSYYFRNYFTDIRQPGPAEQRLKELFPGGNGLMVAMDYLNNQGLFHLILPPEDGISKFELCGRLGKYAKGVEAFLAAWEKPGQRFVLGNLIGDLPAVEEADHSDDHSDLAIRAAALAAQSRQRWLNLARVAMDNGLGKDALYALANANAEDLSEYVEVALTDPSSVNAAIEIIRDDPGWCVQAAEVFEKSLKQDDFRYARSEAALYLAKFGHPVHELVRGLMAEPAQIISAISLAIDYAPDQLGQLLHHGLWSRFDHDRLMAAVILGLVDNEWSRKELVAVLQQSSSQDATIEARCALRESREPAAHRAAERWEDKHPDVGKKDYTPDRAIYDLAGGCERVLRERMRELHDRVQRSATSYPRGSEDLPEKMRRDLFDLLQHEIRSYAF